MEAYTGFAQVYDLFMDNAPYDKWAEFLLKTLRQEGIREGLILDLCCGTGTMTEILADHGYDMIGVDSSEEMLGIAMEKGARRAEKAGTETAGSGEDRERRAPLYLLQDMREFELYGTVRGVICICDSVNYLLEEEELLQTFRLVNNYLDPGGLFVFDFTTVYKYETVIGDTTIAENREEGSFIWENYYDSRREINEYDVTVFVKDQDGGEENLFRRFEEFHYQRGYRLSLIRELVEKSGLTWVRALDADTLDEVNEHSERVYCIARECGKGHAGKGR